MTTFILLGLCASGAWCLHRYIKGSDERDRAEIALFEQPRHLRLVDPLYDQARDLEAS